MISNSNTLQHADGSSDSGCQAQTWNGKFGCLVQRKGTEGTEESRGGLTDTHGLGMGRDWKMAPTTQYRQGQSPKWCMGNVWETDLARAEPMPEVMWMRKQHGQLGALELLYLLA